MFFFQKWENKNITIIPGIYTVTKFYLFIIYNKYIYFVNFSVI